MDLRGLFPILRHGAFYRLVRPLVCLYVRKDRNPPFRLWVDFLCRLLGRAYGKEGRTIWVNAFFPVEIVYAMGACPFIPEIHASLVAYFNLSRRPIELGGVSLSTDICSFFRCAMGLLEDGILPKPDIVLSSSHLCDGAAKFFSEIAKLVGVRHAFLGVPIVRVRGVKERFARQLRDLTFEVAESLGLTFQEKMLSAVLEKARIAWRLIREINVLRRTRPAPFPGSEGLSYVAGMNFYAMGSDEGVRFFAALREYVHKRVQRKRGYLKHERWRVLWLHHIRPYYPNPIFSFLGRHGVSVPFEEANYLYWPEPDPTSPFLSIAEKLLSNPWYSPLADRIEIVKKMAADYGVHGAIHFSHWGCRQTSSGAMLVGEALREMGIRFLVLPGDGCDPDNFSAGQTLTRLCAFVESLGAE